MWLLFFAFLSWLVPFAASFMFYSPQGKLLTEVFLFKSIMVVVSSAVWALLLVLYFGKTKSGQFGEGIKVGSVWFLVNISLDVFFLLPLSGMGAAEYFSQIGLAYLVMPIMAVAIGCASGHEETGKDNFLEAEKLRLSRM